MSKRGKDLVSDDNPDSPAPVRRSTRSRISLGQNLNSSPAPMGIKTRRSSANSISEEKISVEANVSPKEKRITRRASTDEEPKAAPVRSRRSSVSKVIEEEKASVPNSPGRRSTRKSSSSPSLDAPARRTRRSSQETETVEIPARRTTRRSSTGIQESTIEEIVEKAKPVTRRRRSSSIDEQEENVKTESARPKTKKLFNDDNLLEPIEEQEHEIKEKDTEEKQKNIEKLEVIQETIDDDESGKIIENLNEALGETSNPDKNISKEMKTAECTNEIVEKNDITNEQSLKSSNESLNKTIKEVDLESCNDVKEQPITSLPENMSSPEDSTPEEKSQIENSKEKVNLLENPIVQQKSVLEIGEDISQTVTLNEDRDKIQLEKKINDKEAFSSPGSDKENTSVNIKRKRLSIKKIEENSKNEVAKQNGFAIKQTPNSSVCEPMDVDDDEDDVFMQDPTKHQSPKKLILNKSIAEEIIKTGTVKDETVVGMNCSIIENNSTMEGSFSHINSSPDKDSSLLVDESRLSQSSSTLSENKRPSTDNVEELVVDDCESDTSIKLVDTDEEDEFAKVSNKNREEACTNNMSSTLIMPDSELNESILDKSFESTKNSSFSDDDNKTNGKIGNMDQVEKEEKLSSQQSNSEEIVLKNEMVSSVDLHEKGASQDSNVSTDHLEEDPKTIIGQAKDNNESNQLVPSDQTVISSTSEERNPAVDIVTNKDCEETEQLKIEDTIKTKRRSSTRISLGRSIVQNESASLEKPSLTKEENTKVVGQSPLTSKRVDSQIPVRKSKDCKNDSFTSNLESLDSFNIQEMPVIICESIHLPLGKSDKIVPDELVMDENKLSISNTERKEDEDETKNRNLSTESTLPSNISHDNIDCKETLAGQSTVDKTNMETDDDDRKLEEQKFNASKTERSPCSKIILQKIEVVKIIDVGIPKIVQLDTNVQNYISHDNGNNKMLENKEPNLINQEKRSLRSNTTHSLPSNSNQNEISDLDKSKDWNLNTGNITNRISKNTKNEQENFENFNSCESNVQHSSTNGGTEDEKQNRSSARLSGIENINYGNTESEDVEESSVEIKQKMSRLSNTSSTTVFVPSRINKSSCEINLATEKKNVEENPTPVTIIKLPIEEHSGYMEESDDEVHLISSSDDEQVLAPKFEERSPIQKINATRNSKDEIENKDCTISEIETKSSKNNSMETRDSSIDDKHTVLKRKSEGLEETGKKPRLSCGETSSNEKKEMEADQTSGNKKERRTEETIKIMHRSGIDVEDDIGILFYQDTSDFIDDMAEEEEDTSSEEERDENEIIDIGESVLSSDTNEESSEEGYDLDDSFIDNDEEEELLSGEEDFLGEKVGQKSKPKNKKFKRIIRPSSTSDEENEEDKIIKGTESLKDHLAQVDEVGQTEEATQSTNEKFERIVDSIIKLNPAECSTPNKSACGAMNSSKITESSVIIQETCSVGAAKSRIIIDKIQGVVDVFCKNIDDPEGDISLNVSLNYKPPSNSTSARNSLNMSFGTKDIDQSIKNSPNKSSRQSLNEKRNETSISPQRPATETAQIEEQNEMADSENENSNTKDKEHRGEKPINSKTEVSNKKKKSKKKRAKRVSVEIKELAAEELYSGEKKSKSLNHSTNQEKEGIECNTSLESKSNKKKHKTKKEISTAEDHALPLESKNKKQNDQSKLQNQVMLSTLRCDEIGSEEQVEKTSRKAEMVKFKNILDQRTSTNTEKQMKRPRDITELSLEGKKVKYDESIEVKKKFKTEKREESTQKKDKKMNKQNNEFIASTSLHNEEQSQFKTSDIKELKLKKSVIVGRSKHKIVKASREQDGWDEEDIFVKPSAANSTKGGFNLEKYIERDFKNRMIYDSSRNKREPSAPSRRQKKTLK